MTDDLRTTTSDSLDFSRQDRAQAAWWARRNWYWFLIAGVIALVFGVLVLASLWDGIAALAFLVGSALLYIGVVDLMTSTRVQPRWMGVLAGVLALGGGAIALVYPDIALFALAVIAGASFIVWGAAAVYGAAKSRHHGWGWRLILGVVYVVSGVIALVWPGLTILVLTILLGVNALLYGIFSIAQAFLMRKAGSAGGPGGRRFGAA
jgi:uncharacterized membrane protein HdeD (DUF308 family)